MKTQTTMKTTTDRATYQFNSSSEAWSFMRECDAAGFSAGYPGLRNYTVQVEIRTWMDREAVDVLAKGAPVVDYSFAGEEIPAAIAAIIA